LIGSDIVHDWDNSFQDELRRENTQAGCSALHLLFSNCYSVLILQQLVQNFKGIRMKAISILTDMSKELVSIGEGNATAETRKAFVDGCKVLRDTPEVTEVSHCMHAHLDLSSIQIPHDFILDIGKKVTDARKKALDGASKGITRICTNHA
jgi:N-terminal acetyltransferase B complex non-catalytic subunit